MPLASDPNLASVNGEESEPSFGGLSGGSFTGDKISDKAADMDPSGFYILRYDFKGRDRSKEMYSLDTG